MPQQDKNAEFDAQWNATGKQVVVPARGGNNDKFKPELNTVYDRIAILREPSWNIPSRNPGWAPSVAVNLVNLENGNRMDWWFSSTDSRGNVSIFRDRLSTMLNKAKEEGHHYPMEIKFRIQERESRASGNTYKVLQPMFVASGNNIEGDLGVDPRDNPANDASIPASVKAAVPHSHVDRASSEQWTEIKAGLATLFPTGYTVEKVVDLLQMSVPSVTADMLAGSPDGTGLPRLGHGTLSKTLATEVIGSLNTLITE